MHHEEYFVPLATAEAIAQQKTRGGRVVAVGTTSVRTLESAADSTGVIQPGFGSTDIFIRPGYHFRCVDALLTNFHLPRSTLLALVAAFAESARTQSTPVEPIGPEAGRGGLAALLGAYQVAIAERYRFFSFGDAMYID